MIIKNTLKKGLKSGLDTTWELGKVVFPITLIVTLLQHTPILGWLASWLAPFMGWIGLSGDAAIPLVLANFLNIYAGIGSILTFDFTVKEVFIMAVMMSFSHNLLIESTVAAKVGVKLWVVAVVRIGLALISAFLIDIFWKGGNELAQYGLISPSQEELTSWGLITLDGLEKATIGVFQLAVIVIPLMVVIEILKDIKWIDKFSRWMAPVTKMLGMKENTSTTLAAGMIFGIAFGAGVMIQAAKEDNVSKKDLYLALIFLVSCHAVVEDTLIFIPLGIPVWPLLIIRLVVATLLTMAVALIWNRVELQSRKEASYEG